MFATTLSITAWKKPAHLTIVVVAIAAQFSIPAPSTAQEFMSQAELISTIPGKTIQGRSNDGSRWAQAYGKGSKRGKIKGVHEGSKYDAEWYVEGDKWCENWGDGQACWSVERVDERSLRMFNADGSARKYLWVLQD
ncbi:hypothetical protein [Fuscovulum ytuae]|uniref:Uncharacterized protein n=1 Tax=Fuscovulum ytuae TaxID=3042299 RepID=A0ABY8Q5U2_9RHOB|nr:hypothetical protein [Fuscovulum sp. YMD61]WGV15956.1 hypothetical protein QF092_17145 [Fuscovulum sp. YMD61]